MLDALLGTLAWLGRFSDPLAWLVIAWFIGGALLTLGRWRLTAPALVAVLGGLTAVTSLDGGVSVVGIVATLTVAVPVALRFRGYDGGRLLTVGAWVLFAAFWFTLVHHFAFTQKSIIEGIGAAVAVPGSLYVGYLLANGRDSLYVLSRAIAGMGLFFFPFETLLVLKTPLIETVAAQTELLINLLGVQSPEAFQVVNGQSLGHIDARSTFYFDSGEGPVRTYTILVACTGVGSMAIFAGLVGAVRAPLSRKLRALAIALPVIYALNLVRNVFISLSFGQMRLQVAPEFVAGLFGFDVAAHPALVSYYLADRVIAQSMSVVALVAITYLVVREVPEVLGVIEDVLFMVTGSEYDLQALFDEPAVRTDGRGEE